MCKTTPTVRPSDARVLEGYRAAAGVLHAAAEVADLQRQPDQAWAYVHAARYLERLVERHRADSQP